MNVLFKENSISKKIMQVAFLCGCVSYSHLYLIGSSRSTVSKTVKRLVNRGYIEDIHVSVSGRRKRILVPTKKAKMELADSMFKNDVYVLRKTTSYMSFSRVGNTEKDKRRTSALSRATTTSEQALFFLRVFKDLEKSGATFPSPFEENYRETIEEETLTWEKMTYLYPLLPDDAGWRVTRARACLISGRHFMPIYSMPNYPVNMKQATEGLILDELVHGIYGPGSKIDPWMLILSRHYEILTRLVSRAGDEDKGFRIDTNHPLCNKIFLLPDDEDGVKVMEMFLSTGKSERFEKMTVQTEYKIGNRQFTYDYLDGDRYTLSLLWPDALNFLRFLNGIRLYPELKGRVHVYPFEEKAIKELCAGVGNDIEIQVWPINKVEQEIRR